MKKSILITLIFPFIALAHPGVGIVKDSKGNIYFTDLQQVWKITNGKKTIAVPDVHTHELYVDSNDNLYGEGGYYNPQNKKFYHYLWVQKASGKIDTVIGMREQYIQHDFSLARDARGNEYYLKMYNAPQTDTSHIYRKSPGGKETIFAETNVKNVKWLHPQEDGTLLYVSDNAIYRANQNGLIQLVKDNIADAKPSFGYLSKPTIWGVWQDQAKNIFAAVFSDQSVKKIDQRGNITLVYKSPPKWTPLYGVFDNENQLWVMETSDKNEVRVIRADINPGIDKSRNNFWIYLVIITVVLFSLIFFLVRKKPGIRIQKDLRPRSQ